MAPTTVRSTFSLVAVVATLNGVLIQTIMVSRVIYGLADRGHLPVVFAKVSERTQKPIVATFAVVFIIAMFALSTPITSLAEHTSWIVLLVLVLVNVALIQLKMKHQHAGGYFRVPMVVPVLGVIRVCCYLVHHSCDAGAVVLLPAFGAQLMLINASSKRRANLLLRSSKG